MPLDTDSASLSTYGRLVKYSAAETTELYAHSPIVLPDTAADLE